MTEENNTKCEIAVQHHSSLGESPVWDRTIQAVYWVDILEGDIHQYFPKQKTHIIRNIGHTVGAIALRKKGGLIAVLKDGFAEVDFEKKTVKYIIDSESHISENRFNDGKCDPVGRFWAGTMSKGGIKRTASLYFLDTDKAVRLMESNIKCSNGMAWSLDHKTMYHIDSPSRQVVAYDYEKNTGNIKNKTIVIVIPSEYGMPDGMTIDNEGMLWIACWGGWRVCRWNPYTGKLLEQFKFPVSQITSCTFGGENLGDLYVTSARTGLNNERLKNEPAAGCLFVIKNSGFFGIPGHEFLG